MHTPAGDDGDANDGHVALYRPKVLMTPLNTVAITAARAVFAQGKYHFFKSLLKTFVSLLFPCRTFSSLVEHMWSTI
jgi:hypothetical protein